MALEVQEFEKSPKTNPDTLSGIAITGVLVEQEVFNTNEGTEEDPIVEEVLPAGSQGHRVSTEDMDKVSFKDSLQVVSNTKNQTDVLTQTHFTFGFSDQVECTVEDNRTQIFSIENSGPSELNTQILNYNFSTISNRGIGVQNSLIVIQNSLVFIITKSEPLSNGSNLSDFSNFFLEEINIGSLVAKGEANFTNLVTLTILNDNNVRHL